MRFGIIFSAAWILFSFVSEARARPIPLKHFPVSRQTQTDWGGFYRMPLTLGEDFSDARAPIERVRRDMRTAKTLGVQYLRFGFSWLAIEKAPGQYDWSGWDQIVDEAQNAGIQLIPYVSYTPQWATSVQPYDPGNPPDEPETYARFMHELVIHYRQRNPGAVLSWELWNEPDVDTWKGTPEQFAGLVKAAALQVRRADPEAVLFLGGVTLGPSGGFFWPILHELGLADYIDVFAYHVYPETWWPERIEQILPLWPNTMAEWMREAAPQADFWMNEFGYADYRHSRDRASMWSENPDVFYAHEHTPEYQAVQFWKMQLINLATEKISATTWYRINDFKSLDELGHEGDPVNLHLGLLDGDGNPKPIYHAVEAYQSLFGVPVRSVPFVAPNDPASQTVVHVFERKDGDLVVAAWLRSSTLEELTRPSVPADLGFLEDHREEVISVPLPSGFHSGSVSFFNAQGRLIPQSAHLKDGVLENIRLNGREIFLARVRKTH